MVKLERELGPDTTDLSMRFGLHSGPVTAVSVERTSLFPVSPPCWCKSLTVSVFSLF